MFELNIVVINPQTQIIIQSRIFVCVLKPVWRRPLTTDITDFKCFLPYKLYSVLGK